MRPRIQTVLQSVIHQPRSGFQQFCDGTLRTPFLRDV
jgi:hypothetical protein